MKTILSTILICAGHLDLESFPTAKCNFLCFSLGPALPSKQVCKLSLCFLSALSLKVKENSYRVLVWLELQKH